MDMYHLMDSMNGPAHGHYPEYMDNIPRREGSIQNTEISPNSVQTLSPPIPGPIGADIPGILRSDIVPTFEQYPGVYNFQYTIPNPSYGENRNDEDKSRGQNYMFGHDESGSPLLYAKPGHQWPLSYSCDREPPAGCIIRVTPVFKDPDVSQEVVVRCPNHISAASSDEDPIERASIILVTRSSASYIQDSGTNRFCVVLPYQKPDEGSRQTTVNCKFICFSSCQNINRRECYLLITLEIKNQNSGKFDILGRQTLHFRSCACPTRDWSSRKRKGKGGKKAKRPKLEQGTGLSYAAEFPHPMRFMSNGHEYTIKVVPAISSRLHNAISMMVEAALEADEQNESRLSERMAEMHRLESHFMSMITMKQEASANMDANAAPYLHGILPAHERHMGMAHHVMPGGPPHTGDIPEAVVDLVMDHQGQMVRANSSRYHMAYDQVDGPVTKKLNGISLSVNVPGSSTENSTEEDEDEESGESENTDKSQSTENEVKEEPHLLVL